MTNYLSWIREKVGRKRILINAANIVIFDRDGKILLQKRSAEKELWGFPGGMMELGESAEETALREVKEETGLEVKIDSLLGVYTKYFDEYENGDQTQPIVIIFTGKIIGGEFKLDYKETFELGFFEPENAPPMFNSQHKDILDDIKNKRTSVFR